MSEYLTLKEVNELVSDWDGSRVGDTLREYAELVEAVAVAPLAPNQSWSCPFCRRVFDDTSPDEHHSPDCIYLRARKVRGYE